MDGIEGAAKMKELVRAEYPVLADPTGAVTKAYGVFNLLRDGVSAPATYIISPDGSILWSKIGSNIADRASAAEILSALSGLEDL